MGTSKSGAELAHKLGRLAGECRDLQHTIVAESSLIVKGDVSALAPSRLRGVGKRGRKIGVRYNINKYEDGSKSLIYVTGPWHLIERDTAAHDIPRVRGRGRVRYAVVPGGAEGGVHGRGGVRAHVHVKGTKGKHPFARGVAASQPLIRRLYDTKTTVALRRIF